MPSGAPPDSSIRILLADQRQLFASAVHSRLASHPRLELVGVALDGEQAVTLASELAPDIVVLDAELPGVDGPEAMRRICDATGPRMIIVAGADPEVEAHDLGASALLPKARSAADLVEMLEFTALLLDAADSLPAPGWVALILAFRGLYAPTGESNSVYLRQMVRLRLHDPALALDLASFLRRCQCEVRQLGPTMVGVGLGHGVDPEVAASRLEDGRCYRCGEPIEAVLFRLGSPRCHDCREGSGEAAPEPADMWARMEVESYLRIWRLQNPDARVELA